MVMVKYPDGTKRMHTVMHQYESANVVCPTGMNKKNCPLREELADLQQKYYIGYFESKTGSLFFPPFFHSDLYDKDIDLKQLQIEICAKCRGK